MKKSVIITIDDNNITKLEQQAENEGRTVSQYLNQILEEYIASTPEDQSIPAAKPEMANNSKHSISVRLECDTVERIREWAKRDYRTVSSTVNLILRNKL